MFENAKNGDSTLKDFFVPTTKTNTHDLQCWRLVYTEDLRNEAFILRPLAGVGNIATGAFQTLVGIVGTPFGKMPETFKGLGSIGMALPELVFIPVRRAGKCAPIDIEEIQGILNNWEVPEKRTENSGKPQTSGWKRTRKNMKKRPSLRRKRQRKSENPVPLKT